MSAIVLLFALAVLPPPEEASVQAGRETVRVKTKHANVHMGPLTARPVLLLVPRGTVLPVIKREPPWVLVELSPKLRETGIPMRWYNDEKQGWLHESYLEPPGTK